MASTATKSGFDKPLQIVAAADLASLRGLLQHNAPKGTSRPKGFTVGGKTYTYTKPPPAPGRLRASFGKPGAVKMDADGHTIMITSDLPYARIQDEGGIIKAHTQPQGAPNMMYKGKSGVVFTRSRGPITIKPKHYIRDIVNDWLQRRGLKAGKRGITVKWADYMPGDWGEE